LIKYLDFDVDNAEIFDLDSNSEFLTATIDAFSTGSSRNNTYCDRESLERCSSTIYEKPILFTIDKRFSDFYTHIDPQKQDNLIAGFVVPNSGKIVENEDGRSTLQVQAKIWARYAKSFLDVFKFSNSAKKKVSVEVALLDSDEASDGTLNMKNWIFSGICVLGDLITEASPGAKIVMNFAQANEEYKMAFLTEFTSKYDDIDFTIPQSVKANAKKGLELRKEHGRGGTSVGMASARYLVSHSTISPEKIKHIAKYFPRHKGDNLEDKTSNGWIAWQLWGGSPSWKWAQGIVEKMSERDAKNMSYFDTMTFPYKSVGDMNPSLRGIDPPITVSQGNEITKQADAIGSDDKKNGWAIAISNFKKSHEVKDGKWVKKEKKEVMSMQDEKEEVKEEEKRFEEVQQEEPETPEEHKQEPQEEDHENMSLNANLDVKAMLAMLRGETADYEEVSKEFSKDGKMDFGMLAYAMYEKMCKMSEEIAGNTEKMSKMEEDSKAYMSENEELKKFKADIESKQFEFEVASTLKEVEFEIPNVEMAELKEDAKNFSIYTIEGWKNKVKATAFSFSKKTKEDKVFSVGLPFAGNDNKNKSLWG
jgi:hypothetical protein